MTTLTAPFPWFGGKSRMADAVWTAFGNPDNYVEPFFGSGAVLLARPTPGKVETVNDADGLLVNFWRAVRADPEAVTRHADWPVSEADLHPRHATLVARRAEVTEHLMGDPDWYDAKLAGWWVWGACCWIGSGWCTGEGPWTLRDGRLVDTREDSRPGCEPETADLSNAGQGVNRQLPHLGDAGRGWWFSGLADRLRHVRIACGDWTRVVTDSVTVRHGTTAVLLDPPYEEGVGYGATDAGVSVAAAAWAAEHGDRMRVAYCGYDGGPGSRYLADWRTLDWSAVGYGAGRDGDGETNRHRERVWFSPACRDAQPRMFDLGGLS